MKWFMFKAFKIMLLMKF